jgi:hypothetical protein
MLMPFAFQQSGTVAPWTPLLLPLYGWYKADVGTGVSTDGAAVSAWQDQSGYGKHLAQATPANRGVFRTAANGVNGLPVLEFAPGIVSTSTHRSINDTAFLGSDSDGFSFYIVSRNLPTRTQYGGAWIVGTATAGGISQFCDLTATGSVALRFQNGSGDWNTGDATSTNYNVAKISCGSSINSYKHKSTYIPARNQPSSSPSNTIMGAGFSIGANYYGSVGSRIAEVIVCNRELTTGAGSEEASLDAYFRSRYGFGLYYGADLPVAGAALWIDGSRSDKLYSDAGISLVTADAGAIQQANDLSGNGLNASQTVLGYRPQYRTPINGQNGLSAIQHNSTGWYFTTAAATLGEYTAFSVMTSGWAGTGYRAVFGHGYGSTGQAFMTTGSAIQDWLASYLFAAGNGYPSTYPPRAVGPHGTLASGSAQLITAVAGSSGSTVRLNGTSVATASTNATVTPSSVPYYLGHSGFSSDYHDGKTCETIIYPRILSGSEISQVEAYLKAKWNTP